MPLGSPNPPFFLREYFSRALLSECLEQATGYPTGDNGHPRTSSPPPPPTPAVRLSQSSLIHLRRSVQFLCVLVCPLSCYGHIFQRFLIINVVGDWVWILTCDNLPILVERCTLSFSDDHYTLWGWVGSRAFVFSLRCKTYESSSHF